MSGRITAPTMTPRRAGFDLSGFDVPHREPFLLDLVIDRDHLGEVIEHVANTEYVRWLDRAAELHADSLGYTRSWLLDNSLMWFVARHEIDYLSEVWLDDKLVVATWVRDMKRVKSWRDYVVVRESDMTVVCRAATLWVFVDLQSRRPKRIEPEMAMRFNPLHRPAYGRSRSVDGKDGR